MTAVSSGVVVAGIDISLASIGLHHVESAVKVVSRIIQLVERDREIQWALGLLLCLEAEACWLLLWLWLLLCHGLLIPGRANQPPPP